MHRARDSRGYEESSDLKYSTHLLKVKSRSFSISVAPASVILGGSSLAVALASDPDGDQVTYLWSVEGGAMLDSTAGSTTWTAPDTAGAFWLRVEVSDGVFTVEDSTRVLAGEGRLTVTSDPPGAFVNVDGSKISHKTPHTFEKLSIGPHRVTINRPSGARRSSWSANASTVYA